MLARQQLVAAMVQIRCFQPLHQQVVAVAVLAILVLKMVQMVALVVVDQVTEALVVRHCLLHKDSPEVMETLSIQQRPVAVELAQSAQTQLEN